MIIGSSQFISANWKDLKGKLGTSKYNVIVEIEGPERPMMTDISPIRHAIRDIDGKDLSVLTGKSSTDNLCIYIRDMVQKMLEPQDKIKKVKIIEMEVFTVELP
jgi:hypothetical protein